MKALQLNYTVPISDSFQEDGDFIIQGTAINATTTDNGHTFLVEELRPSAASLTGVPLLIDHNNTVESIKGKVLSGTFNEVDKRVDFKAKVLDKNTIQLIKDGLLNTVSVGANVKEVDHQEDGTFIARGIKFKELSLVAVPADDGATFAIAMREAYETEVKEVEVKEKKDKKKKTKESQSIDIHTQLEGGQKEMNDNNVLQEVLNEIKSLKEDNAKSILEIKEELAAIKVKEADVDEPKEEAEEAKPEVVEPKEEESKEEEDEDEDTEESAKFSIVEGNGSIRGSSFTYNW